MDQSFIVRRVFLSPEANIFQSLEQFSLKCFHFLEINELKTGALLLLSEIATEIMIERPEVSVRPLNLNDCRARLRRSKTNRGCRDLIKTRQIETLKSK